MAIRPTYVNLNPIEAAQLQRNARSVSPLDALLQGLNQGVQLQQMPETLNRESLNNQLATALQQAKINQLQTGEIQNVGGRLVRVKPATGVPEILLDVPTQTATPTNFQLVGSTQAGGPMLSFDPRRNAFTVPTSPEGINISGPFIPKTLTPETQQLAGFDAAGNPTQFGTRGSGLSTVPVQAGVNIAGPLQPKTQAAMRKGVLLQDEKGNVSYDVLSEGESVPEGSRLFTEPKAADESGLRKEFISNPVVKDFTDIAPQYQRIQSALDEAKTTKNFTAVDQTLVNTFNRILDPQSVVREAEYARTASDQSVLNYLKGKYDPKTGRLSVGGAGITPETREAMQRMAKRFFDSSQNNYTQTAAFYSSVARNRGFDPELIVPPIGGFNFTQAPVGQSPAGNQNAEALQWLQLNPGDSRAPAIRKKLGL